MASSLFVLATLSLALLITKSQADLINTICSKTTNPSLCDEVLRSDPRSKGADLAGLGQISIDKGRDAVKAATAVVKTEGRSKEIVGTCVEVFSNAIHNLKECKKLLKPRNVESLRTYASAALTDVGTCDNEFGLVGEPSKVRQANQKAGDIVRVLLAIAALLKGGN